ncbi:META domain-containing protein [Methanochimaera problematica]|nr:META domain-containing protein [Methanoplanus sp. FWC-SCC4]
MKYSKILIILIILAATIFSGCTDSKTPATPTPTPIDTQITTETATQKPVEDMVYRIQGLWILSNFEVNEKDTLLKTGTEITTRFDTQGNISGSAGCNNYFGNYQISGSSISIGPLGSTMMYCEDIMDQETLFLQMLQNSATIMADGDTLTIKNDTAKEKLIFHRYSPPKIAGTWHLRSYTSKGENMTVVSESPLTAVFGSDGSLSGYAGCNNYNGNWEEKDEVLTIGPLISTKMYCEDTMEQETLFLEILQNSMEYMIEGDKLTIKDKDGNELIFWAVYY